MNTLQLEENWLNGESLPHFRKAREETAKSGLIGRMKYIIDQGHTEGMEINIINIGE